MSTGQEVARLPGLEGVLTFSPDGYYLLTTDGRLWEMNSRKQLSRLMTGDEVLVHMAFGAGGGMLAIGSQSGGTTVWDVNAGRLVARLPEGPHTTIQAFSPDGRYLATMSGVTLGSTWNLRLWEVMTGREINEISPGGQINAVVFSPDGRYIVTGDREGRVVRFATTTGGAVDSMQVDPQAPVSRLVFSPDGEQLMVTSEAGKGELWRPSSNEKTPSKAGGKSGDATASSRNGRYLGVGSTDGTVVVWDVMSGRELPQKSFNDPVRGLFFSADGRHAAAAGKSTVYVWETLTGKDVATIRLEDPETERQGNGPTESHNAVSDMMFSSDGEWLAIVGLAQPQWEYTVSLWHNRTGRKLATLAKGVGEVTFDPDSSRMAIAEKDGTVWSMFWHPQSLVDEACARVGRDFTVQEWQTYFAEDTYQPTCRELRAPPD